MIHRPSRAAEIGQWVFLLAVLALGALLASMLADNLARRNLSFGFGFLGARAGFDIPFHLISWTINDTYARALLVSLLNHGQLWYCHWLLRLLLIISISGN